MLRATRTFFAFVLIVTGVLISMAIPQPDVAFGAKPTRATKYEICHRTNALKNPYRRITVAWGGHQRTPGSYWNRLQYERPSRSSWDGGESQALG